MPETLKARIPFKSGTAAQWASFNPILLSGEPGYETDTGILRIGDGVTAFVSLRALEASIPNPASATTTITGSNGISGGGSLAANRVLQLAGQARAFHDLAAFGIVVRNAADKAVTRSVAGTSNQITVTNGNGVNGNPTISAVIASQAEAEAGTNTTKLMTAQRVSQAIAALAPPPTTSSVLAALAGAAAGAVGTYALLGVADGNAVSLFGETRAGSELFPAGFGAYMGFSTGGIVSAGGAAGQDSARAGTWRCMGVLRSQPAASSGPGETIPGIFGATLWLRIA